MDAPIVIIGSGPAAHAAALFASAEHPILFEGGFIGGIGPGGQLTTTTHVDNYPGFPTGTLGPDLMKAMRRQSEEAGVVIRAETVESVTIKDNTATPAQEGTSCVGNAPQFLLKTEKGTYTARCVIVATGASAKRLYVPGTGEEPDGFWQRGISACAVCDGFFFRNKVVGVIGGGDSAMEEALYLSKIAKTVFLIHRRNEFRARSDKLAIVKRTENIILKTPTEVVSAHGDDVLTHVMLQNSETGATERLNLDGLFFAIGHVPNTGFLAGLPSCSLNDASASANSGRKLVLDGGYLVTDKAQATGIAGVFACGDVQDKVFRQAITAAASGSVAARSALKYLKETAL